MEQDQHESTRVRDESLAAELADIDRRIHELAADWHRLGDEKYNQALALLETQKKQIVDKIEMYKRSR